MTTNDFPVPLAGPRDWRVPLARRLVLAVGWLAFTAGIGLGAVGVARDVAFAWVAPAAAAVLALMALVLVPEPRPVGPSRAERRRLRRQQRHPQLRFRTLSRRKRPVWRYQARCRPVDLADGIRVCLPVPEPVPMPALAAYHAHRPIPRRAA